MCSRKCCNPEILYCTVIYSICTPYIYIYIYIGVALIDPCVVCTTPTLHLHRVIINLSTHFHLIIGSLFYSKQSKSIEISFSLLFSGYNKIQSFSPSHLGFQLGRPKGWIFTIIFLYWFFHINQYKLSKISTSIPILVFIAR